LWGLIDLQFLQDEAAAGVITPVRRKAVSDCPYNPQMDWNSSPIRHITDIARPNQRKELHN